MRTTVNLDERVVLAARARASQRGLTMGEALSELALAGLEAESSPASRRGGIILLPAVEGHVITNDMVAEALDDD